MSMSRLIYKKIVEIINLRTCQVFFVLLSFIFIFMSGIFFIFLSFIFIFMLFGKSPVIWFKVYWVVHFLQNTDVVGLGIVIKGSFVQIIASPSKKKLGLLVVSWFDLNVGIFYVIFETKFSKWSLLCNLLTPNFIATDF